MTFAIEALEISKQYEVPSSNAASYRTLREEISSAFTSFRRSFVRQDGTAAQKFWALRDVSFEVEPGQIVGVIGRNGAGKSTLLKILSRITPPTSGQAKLRGRVRSLLEVGTGFHPELSGRENIFLSGVILGMKRSEIARRFDEIVAFAEIERFLELPVKRYSSGMYVRLAFSVAAFLDPDVLIVDEVLAVGDAAFQEKCLGRLRSLEQARTAVLLVSHNPGHIQNHCDQAFLLDAGCIAARGIPQEVLALYRRLGTFNQGKLAWPDPSKAPGNENVRLRSVTLSAQGESNATFLVSDEIAIEIEYETLQPGLMLDPSLYLKDSTGAMVLASVSRPSANAVIDAWAGVARPKGVFRSKCVIPHFLLNTQLYSLDINISNSFQQWEVRERDLLSFRVQETGEMTREFGGHWEGAVRPRLAWTTSQLS